MQRCLFFLFYSIFRFSDLNVSASIMEPYTDKTDDYTSTTDGYHDTSARSYQMNIDRNMSTYDDWWNTTTDVHQSYWNGITDVNITDDQMTIDEYSAVSLALLVLNWTLCPFILTGNSLTIAVVTKYIKNVTPTHVSIAFLAVGGISIGIVDFFDLVVHLMGYSTHSEYVYRLLTLVSSVAMGLNISAIFLIAFERCCLLTSRKWHQKYLTVRRQIGLCVTLTVYFMILATILAFVIDYEFRYRVLVPMFEEKIVVYATTSPTYVLITCSTAYCYLKISLFVWKHRKSLLSGQNSSNGNKFQKEKATTCLIAIILTVYLCGTSPTSAYALIISNNPQFVKPELWAFFRMFWYATSLADIFIYVLKVPEFKNGYQKIFCYFLKCPTNQVVPQINVQPSGTNFPLEPRKHFACPEPAINSSAPAKQSGAKDTLHVPQPRKGNEVLFIEVKSADENWQN